MAVIQLECQCNSYPWGKIGSKSLAAQYAAATPGRYFHIDTNEPYAEMWMGTYPTTPSQILSTGENLQQHLDKNQERLIGRRVLTKFGADLPFLPKILSIAKALPLQIHPDKQLAAQLHKDQPDKFSDANHKPEIAVALGPFEVFVGWMPLDKIQHLFTSIPILQQFADQDNLKEFTNETLKSLVGKMLSASDSQIIDIFTALRDMPETTFAKQSHIPSLLPRLAEQYEKSDPGTLVALLTMNFLVLQKGEAIYVPADGIHAYLSGDIVECMARSDNVLNAGFCHELIPSGKGLRHHTRVLAPPMSEFRMLITEIKAGETETIEALQGPSIMVVTAGSGNLKTGGEIFDLKEGYVFFVGYDTQIELATDNGLEVHMAYCEA